MISAALITIGISAGAVALVWFGLWVLARAFRKDKK